MNFPVIFNKFGKDPNNIQKHKFLDFLTKFLDFMLAG